MITEPAYTARLRTVPEDFQVSEVLGFQPGGGGEHLWLRLRKRGWNTEDVAMTLARQVGLPRRAVSFSGLKDRHAVTEQWFSLHLPGRDDVRLAGLPQGLDVIEQLRHGRKLQRGTHKRNQFQLRLRALRRRDDEAFTQTDQDRLAQRLQQLREQGMANYFGEQRFGHGGNNWLRGSAWLRGEGAPPRKRALRSLWLSAVRSQLFNLVLAERQRLGVWNQLLPGDVLQPDGSGSLFHAAQADDAAARIAAGELHPTAPLPGVGGLAPQGLAVAGECAALEQQLLAPHQPLLDALAGEQVAAQRRACRVLLKDLHWQWQSDDLLLDFSLPAGAFATSLLAHLVDWHDLGERERHSAVAAAENAKANATQKSTDKREQDPCG